MDYGQAVDDDFDPLHPVDGVEESVVGPAVSRGRSSVLRPLLIDGSGGGVAWRVLPLAPLPLQTDGPEDSMSTSYERIYAVVKRIPRGRVATYGQVADLAGLHGHARQVGYALHATPAHVRIPWQRVVNSKGEISLRPHEGGGDLQAALLEAEGVEFSAAGRIDLDRYQWKPRRVRIDR